MADKTNTAIEVEESSSVVSKAKVSIKGLEDIPSNIIPVPFYKLVQPGSTNVTLADGTDAPTGSIFMMDKGDSTTSLKFALLRGKRINKEFTNEKGEAIKTVTIGMLGINTENYTPFILSISVSSFANFGRLMQQLKDRKADSAWAYPIAIKSEKKEETKDTPAGRRVVKYYVLNFSVGKNKFPEDELSMLEDAYSEFASSLDRESEEELKVKSDEAKESGEDLNDEVDPNDTPF